MTPTPTRKNWTVGQIYRLDNQYFKCKSYSNGVGVFYRLDQNMDYDRGKTGINGDNRKVAIIANRLYEMELVELRTEQIKLEL